MNIDLLKTEKTERDEFLAQSKQMLDLSLTFFERVLAHTTPVGDATVVTFSISKKEAENIAFAHCHFRVSDARLSALCASFASTISSEGITSCSIIYFAHAAHHCIYDTDIPRFDGV